MQHIDGATKGLGLRIIEDYNKAEIDEAGKFSRTMGRIGNALLSPFSASARGKAKQAKAVAFLMGKFKEYARGRPYTPQLIYQYLSGTFGKPLADTIMTGGKSNNNPPPPSDNATTPQNNPTNPNAPAPAGATAAAPPAPGEGTAPGAKATTTTTPNPSQIPGSPDDKAQTLMKQPTAGQPTDQNATAENITKSLLQAAQAEKTNPKLINDLFNQYLSKTAKAAAVNTPEHARQLSNAKKLQTNLAYLVPDIGKIDVDKMFSESVRSARRKIR